MVLVPLTWASGSPDVRAGAVASWLVVHPDPATAAWHAVYLLGLRRLALTAALLRDWPSGCGFVLGFGVAFAAVAASAGWMQLR
jgi:hypothetical protein